MLKDPCALIIGKETWGDFCLLTLHSPKIARGAAPGQFLMVRVNDQPYPLLRRPFSIHDRQKNRLMIFFSKAGAGTALLAARNPGETLDIVGPLGRGFRLGGRKTAGRTAFLVGGGRGIAPMIFLARELRARGVRTRIFYGGRTESHLPLLPALVEQESDIFVSTDDGSLGYHGFICPMLERELARWLGAPRRGRASAARRPEIFVCGPDPMMKAGPPDRRQRTASRPRSRSSRSWAAASAPAGAASTASATRAADGWRKICEDGPVFAADEILWDES